VAAAGLWTTLLLESVPIIMARPPAGEPVPAPAA
jgi:hypothetical protein